MKLSHSEPGKNIFAFRCECCGAKSELTLFADDRHPFACPEGCGAAYVQYDRLGKPALMCVVRPMYADEEQE